ncbi:tryptophanyl-tRNA synthase [[Pasteurella] aerogenes]|nr:tryptophanyl-tRNA synthase [[Pasteurella] aerogenes]
MFDFCSIRKEFEGKMNGHLKGTVVNEVSVMLITL